MKIGAHFRQKTSRLHRVGERRPARATTAWLVDSQMLWEDVWVYMTHALAETERIQIGVAVANPHTPLLRERQRRGDAGAAASGPRRARHGRGDSAVRTLGRKQVATTKMAEIDRPSSCWRRRRTRANAHPAGWPLASTCRC